MWFYPTLFIFLTVTYSPSESRKRCRCSLSQKHHRTDDIMPPHAGILRIFAMRFCPYSHKNILVLKAKQIPHDIVYINLDHKPAWLYKYSPKGTVPALEYERNDCIYDSSIINEYLDEGYPEPPLQSNYPLRRAQDRMVMENFKKLQSLFMTAAFDPEDLKPKDIEKFHKLLGQLQYELEERGNRFLFGDQPGLVDYNLWPFLERIEALVLVANTEFELSPKRYFTLLAYMEEMKEVPAVKAYYLTPEVHAQYITSKRSDGDTNYNFLENSAHCCKNPF